MKFISIFDDTKTVTGSVYLTPTYSSGTESGQPMRTAPATLHMTPDIGAPARHMNYVLFGLGDNQVKTAQHQAMRFTAGKDWPSTSVHCATVAKANRGFHVITSATVSFTRDARLTGALSLAASNGLAKVVHDDGFHIVSCEVEPGVSSKVISASTVTNVSLGGGLGFTPLAAATLYGNTLVLGTSGTSLLAGKYSGTASTITTTSVTMPGGTYNASSTSQWNTAQVFSGATTSTGPAIFYSRGFSNTTSSYMISYTGTDLTGFGWLGSGFTTDSLADIAYDDVQGLFIAAGYSSTGSRVSFFTSPNGQAWTASSTATGPAQMVVGGSVVFTICSGVWFLATTGSSPADFDNFAYGTGTSGGRVCAVYSLDYGVTWYPAYVDMVSCTAGTLRAKSSVDQILLSSDSDVCLSGRIGYSELIT
jgi:hypothetical protein